MWAATYFKFWAETGGRGVIWSAVVRRHCARDILAAVAWVVVSWMVLGVAAGVVSVVHDHGAKSVDWTTAVEIKTQM